MIILNPCTRGECLMNRMPANKKSIIHDLEEEYDPALKHVNGSDRDMFAYDQDELADMAQHLGAQVVGI